MPNLRRKQNGGEKRPADYFPLEDRGNISQPIAKRTRSCTQKAEPLHPPTCQGKPDDIYKMLRMLYSDPDALDRPQTISATEDQDWFPHKVPPICDASWMRHQYCVHFLLSRGAECCGAIALLAAFLCESDTNEQNVACIVKMLLKHEPIDHSKPMEAGIYTLMLKLAVENSWNRVLQMLLEAGAVVDVFADMITTLANLDRTPLSVAVCKSNFQAMKLLLFHGASSQISIDCIMSNRSYCIKSLAHFAVGFTLDAGMDPSVEHQRELVAVCRVFRALGGNLWVKCKDPDDIDLPEDSVLAYLNRRPNIIKEYNYVCTEVESLMKNPLSLLSLSRLAVKSAMGRDYWKNIHKLAIPASLKPFLKYQITYLNDTVEKKKKK
ncbi:hypothetical protein B566_EDAN009505 [Ephemera danica]|nr:hypothetical protein B566_EDAN009505 [Ephemera danica]